MHYISAVIRKYTFAIIYHFVFRILHRLSCIFYYSFDSRNSSTCLPINYSHLPISGIDISSIDKNLSGYHSSMFLSHRFNLLGSGWVKNSFFCKPLGVEGYCYNSTVDMNFNGDNKRWLLQIVRSAYLKKSSRIWSKISSSYFPIDWQKDYKSGYRWSAKKWYKDQPIGHLPGVDIKVPWELARMQHLPQMAVFAMCLPEIRPQLILEFKNQILDFIATNPPKMGVNWTCSMDVGIRAANMIVAYDLFSQIDNHQIITADFIDLFASSIYQHGRHIVSNLENNSPFIANHYLADIAGLLFIAAYLKPSPITDRWLAFSIIEFGKEADRQFNTDGSNFEASTSYHRLSGEILAYSIALISGLEADRVETLLQSSRKFAQWVESCHSDQSTATSGSGCLPASVLKKLKAAAKFTLAITKPNGNIVQIGDNDSGRFFKFAPVGALITNREAEKRYRNLQGYNELLSKNNVDDENGSFWDENDLDHLPFVSAVAGLFDPDTLGDFPRYRLEESIVRSLSKKHHFPLLDEPSPKLTVSSIPHIPIDIRQIKETVFDFSGAENLTEKSDVRLFPDFGLIIVKSKRLFLAVMTGSIGKEGCGGHAHNDKLSFELNVDGNDVVVDAGTYLYSPIPEMRNKFRSAEVHSSVRIEGKEQGRWESGYDGLFGMNIQDLLCGIHEISNDIITVYCKYSDIIHIRTFKILANKIIVVDYVNCPFSVLINRTDYYSNGYGKVISFKSNDRK